MNRKTKCREAFNYKYPILVFVILKVASCKVAATYDSLT